VSVVWLAYGVGFAFALGSISSTCGVDLDPAGMLIARYLASAFLGIAPICWSGRGGDSDRVRGITIGLDVTNRVGFLAGLVGVLSGVVSVLDWRNVVNLLLMAQGHGCFGFMRPNASRGRHWRRDPRELGMLGSSALRAGRPKR
jgi:hypothetical protein